MVAIAVFVMSGTAVATVNVIVVNNNVTTVQSGNAIDKFIALIKSYTKKVNATKTIDELMALVEESGEELMAFEQKYAYEINLLEEVLTEAQMAAYDRKFEAALAEFEAAIDKQVEQLMESNDIDDNDF